MKFLLYVSLFLFSTIGSASSCPIAIDPNLIKDSSLKEGPEKPPTEASGFLEDDFCETKPMDTLDGLLGKSSVEPTSDSNQ